MARTTADITMFNKIFSVCNTTAPDVALSGMRIGYPTNWWAALSNEVCPFLPHHGNIGYLFFTDVILVSSCLHVQVLNRRIMDVYILADPCNSS